MVNMTKIENGVLQRNEKTNILVIRRCGEPYKCDLPIEKKWYIVTKYLE